jgi:hypothetical protein
MSTIRITKPAANERQSVSFPAEAGERSVELGFNTGEANVERIDNDLVFRFDDGAETRFTGFFVTDGEALPKFVLVDGAEVASADILRQLNSDMDLKTAAGPGGANTGGGAGEYASDAGDLIGGVDGLGSLGTDYWSRGAGAPEDFIAPPAVLADGGLGGPVPTPATSGPGNPAGPGGGVDDPGNPDERLVMYMASAAEGLDMQALAQFKMHKAGELADDNAPKYGTASISEGKLVYTLGEDGVQALAEKGEDGIIVDYVSYVDENGVAHTVQVVLTTGAKFLSGESGYDDPENPDFKPGQETHYSHRPGGGYDVKSTGGDDVLTFKNALTGGNVEGGDGADTIHLDKSVAAANGGETRVDGGETRVDGGIGNDEIHIIGNVYALGDDTGSPLTTTTVEGGEGNDSIHIEGQVYTQGGASAKTTVSGGIGDDTIHIDKLVAAANGGETRVDGGIGNDEIHITGDVLAKTACAPWPPRMVPSLITFPTWM